MILPLALRARDGPFGWCLSHFSKMKNIRDKYFVLYFITYLNIKVTPSRCRRIFYKAYSFSSLCHRIGEHIWLWSVVQDSLIAPLRGQILSVYGFGRKGIKLPYTLHETVRRFQRAGSNIRFIVFACQRVNLFRFVHHCRIVICFQSLNFSSTNIRTLVQLNALATVRRLDSLVIESEGNPVTRLMLWRPYVIFRLAHFTLKRVNGVEVGERLWVCQVMEKLQNLICITRLISPINLYRFEE